MQINEAGLSLIKNFEGCRLTCYKDIAGLKTVGYGHRTDIMEVGQCITQDQADALLQADLTYTENAVTHLVMVPLNGNQFSALCSFVFNIGAYHFKDSTLLEKLNDGDYSSAADEFLRWNHVNGQMVEGLTDRREAERNLFLKA